tara:strand:- start:8344 stop:8670 length:327 start_codon:yes stop_codon:yes gene_type:complete
MHFDIKTNSLFNESKKRATRRKKTGYEKARNPTKNLIFARYLEKLSIWKMDYYPLGFPLYGDNLYLRAICFLIYDFYLLVLVGIRSIDGNCRLLGLITQIGTKSRIFG